MENAVEDKTPSVPEKIVDAPIVAAKDIARGAEAAGRDVQEVAREAGSTVVKESKVVANVVAESTKKAGHDIKEVIEPEQPPERSPVPPAAGPPKA